MELRDLRYAFRALSDVARLRIIQHLAGYDETTVSELTRILHISQPLASWHLRQLRRARLVTTRRVGRQVFCSLNRAWLGECLQAVAGWSDRWVSAPRSPQTHPSASNLPILHEQGHRPAS